MANTLILYSTTDGHTLKICSHIQQWIEQRDATAQVSLEPIESFHPEPGSRIGERVVIGASIRYGKHSRAVYAFIERYQDWLEARPNAFFSVNVVARKPGKDLPETNPYLQKFLRQISWKPDLLEVFAGRICYAMYGFWDRTMIRLIMWLTKGPTEPEADVEFTDWQRVDAFAERIASGD